MARKTFEPEAIFRGPFRGLNTTIDARHQDQRWARRARNVILSENRIRPRAPWRYAGTEFAIPPLPEGHFAIAMTTWLPPRTRIPQAVIYSGPPRYLWTKNLESDTGLLTQIGGDTANSGSPPGAVDWHRQGDWLYCLDGRAKHLKTDGQAVRYVGLEPPVLKAGSSQPPTWHVEIPGSTQGAGGSVPPTPTNPFPGTGIGARVAYGCTAYDSYADVESNAVFSHYFDVASGSGAEIRLFLSLNPPAGLTQWTHVRFYRRNFTTGGNGVPGFRYLGQVPVTTIGQIVDSLHESQITASDPVSGPFAPTRNDHWGHASCGCVYDRRLVINDTERPGVVRFSAIGKFDYVERTDEFLVIGDPEDAVTGLHSTGDQIYVGKPRRIWRVSGELRGPSNDEVATGATVPPFRPSVLRTDVTIGPDEDLGNGFVRFGAEGRVAFRRKDGFFEFTGLGARQLSEPIKELWRSREHGRWSVVDDVIDGVLYVHLGADSDEQVLLYHYRLDQWTDFDVAGMASPSTGPNNPSVPAAGVSAMAATLDAVSGAATSYRSIVAVTRSGHFVGDEQRTTGPRIATMHDWVYETAEVVPYPGRLFAAKVLEILATEERPPPPVENGAGLVVVEVLVDPDDRNAAPSTIAMGVHDMSEGRTTKMGTEFWGERYRLRFRRDPRWMRGYAREYGIQGWTFDTRRIGAK